MKNNCSPGEIIAALREHERFVVISHLRPDGDALGCEIAMALALQGLGKQVKVWNEDGLLQKYSYLPGSGLVTRPPEEPETFDVAIALDTAAHKRLGTPAQAVKQAKIWINIDHHVSNERYGDLVYIDRTAPATGQILYELFRLAGFPITRAIADNLFVAISTDTGSFQYPNTSARTYEIGAELLKAGVEVGKLSQQMYESHPRRRVALLRELLNVLKFSCRDRVASFALSMETARRTGALPEDNEGLIDIIRAIDGVIVAAFFEEIPEGKVRISLRSKDPGVDVCKICAQFGGGGHTLAAGARARGSLAEIEEKVLNAICHEIAH
jgi:phosphoesterase RecJ-like protein